MDLTDQNVCFSFSGLQEEDRSCQEGVSEGPGGLQSQSAVTGALQ